MGTGIVYDTFATILDQEFEELKGFINLAPFFCGSMGLGGMSSGRMGGFGSESGPRDFGGYSGGVYGDGGGFGGESSNEGYGDTSTQARRDKFEEYDEYDEGAVAAPGRRQSDVRSPPRAKRETKKPAAKPKEPEEDLFDFGDEPTTTTSTSNGKAPVTSNTLGEFGAADDDDFDDFQSAAPAPAPAAKPAAPSFSIAPPASTSTTTSATQFAQPKPVSAAQAQGLNDIFATVSPPPQSTTSAFTPLSPPASQNKLPQPTGYQNTGPNYFQPVQTSSTSSTPLGGGIGPKPTIGGGAGGAKAAGGDPFASMLGGGAKKTGPNKGVSMADMARQKASAGIWGSGTNTPASGTQQSTGAAQNKPLGNGLDDLLG